MKTEQHLIILQNEKVDPLFSDYSALSLKKKWISKTGTKIMMTITIRMIWGLVMGLARPVDLSN
jgi:hypothetical protein